MFDVSPLVPLAQPIAARAAEVYLAHTRSWFVGLLVHGSALKGGVIHGCSDVDLQLYLENELFDADGQIPLSLAAKIQRDLTKIDPAPFQYIQCYSRARCPHHAQPKFLGPVPGAYHLLLGELPIPEATADELLRQAIEGLSSLNPVPFKPNSLLERGGGRLERAVRLLCTNVWPTMFRVLTVQTEDPLTVWRLPKDEAIRLMLDITLLGGEIDAFYQAVLDYYPAQESVEEALAVIAGGVSFLTAVSAWWRESQASRLSPG